MAIIGNARDWQLRLRLWAAYVLMTYALGYYSYYIVGLFSPRLMEEYALVLQSLWPLFWVFPLVLAVHVALGLWKVYRRNTLKMPHWEKVQILLGLGIPFFFLPHIVYTYGVLLLFGKDQIHASQILSTYPEFSWQFIAMALVVWGHAQIGAHVVFRMRKWYPRARVMLILLFSLIPVLGIAGYVRSGVEALSSKQKETIDSVSLQELAGIRNLGYSVYVVFPTVYLFVIGARALRIQRRNKNRNSTIRYMDGKEILVFPGTTILEASRIGNVPHASICGGRGRCTTCRVRIESGMENLSPIAEREHKALMRIEAQADVRLACQAECKSGNVAVTLLLPPDVKSYNARNETVLSVGKEMELAVMFIDLRGFTQLSEEKMPYDVVFILNNYFNNMGEIIERNEGTIDKFLGDGILAYFGINGDHERACFLALKAAKEMDAKLRSMNENMKYAVAKHLEIGIGIHFGEVILGKLGYKNNASLTIIGDTVNTASRLEGLNKKAGSKLIFSKAIADSSKTDLSHLKKYKILVRGRKVEMEIFVVKDVQTALQNVT